MKVHDTIAQVLKNKRIGKTLSVAPDDTVYDALKLMAQHDVGALLVLANGELAGIFSERDYARRGILEGHASRETRVSQLMTPDVVSISPQHTVDECMALMTERRFRHLPVVDKGSVTGVVSIGDLVKWVITRQDHAIQELEHYVTGGFPA